MSIRVRSGAQLDFGTNNSGSAVSVTHVRFRRGSDNAHPVVKQLSAPVSVAPGAPFTIPDELFNVVYHEGDLTNAHMQALVEGYWGTSGNRTEMEIDLMTAVNTVVAATGYLQETHNGWEVTQI